MAVAHQILIVIYHMLRDGTPYAEPGAAYYDEKRKPAVTRHLVERLQRLGYIVTLEVPMEADSALAALPEPPPPELLSH